MNSEQELLHLIYVIPSGKNFLGLPLRENKTGLLEIVLIRRIKINGCKNKNTKPGLVFVKDPWGPAPI